ncbi:MAG TPA: MMPL family transporter [Pirellulaceae bacterium]|nr:MMPL family transporter [Pirellulaceae bacterium]HMO90603.1 MMPL family transporter [Pirellulaceae bacterium]HMP67818.1 MMPL family transporter [Pirellulaceae bacterium]
MNKQRILDLATISVTALACAISVSLILGARSNTQDWQNWVDVKSHDRQVFDDFQKHFGSSDYILASWDGCRVDDERLIEFKRKIDALDEQNLVDHIVSGMDIIEQLTQRDAGFSASQARRRLKNVFFGNDLEVTCVSIKLSDQGSHNRRESVELLYNIADQVTGLGRDKLKLLGHAYLTVEMDRLTKRTALWAPPALLAALVVAWLGVHSFRLILVPMIVSGVAGLFSLAIAVVINGELNGLLVVMPCLVITICLSSAVHALKHFQIAVSQGVSEPEKKMVLTAARPVVFAMFTSAVGVGSLIVGRVPAVKQFGTFSAIAIIVALILLMTLFPSLLRLLQIQRVTNYGSLSKELDPLRRRLFELATRRPMLTVAAMICVLAFAVAGLSRLNVNLDSAALIRKYSKFSQDRLWFEEQGLASKAVEFVVWFDRASEEDVHLQVRSLLHIQAVLNEDPRVLSSVSIASLIHHSKYPSLSRGVRDLSYRTTFNEGLLARQSQLENNGLLAVVDGRWHWRITASCQTDERIDLKDLIEDNTRKIKELSLPMPGEVHVIGTGLVPIARQGHHSLFADLTWSFFLAFAIITPLVIVLLRSVAGGFLAMLPNVFPAGVFFGMLGWFEFPVDVGLVLTASVGLGIAVDNTFHFLHNFRMAYMQKGECSQTVCIAYQQCSGPMLLTTAICCSSLIMFSFAEFVPASQFAIAIVLILLLATAADLMFLPALVSLARGTLFARGRSRH